MFFFLATVIAFALFFLWEKETILGQAVSGLLILVMLMCLTMAILATGIIHV